MARWALGQLLSLFLGFMKDRRPCKARPEETQEASLPPMAEGFAICKNSQRSSRGDISATEQCIYLLEASSKSSAFERESD